MDTTTRVPIANKPMFENLKVLHVMDLKNLKELCVGELPHGSLGNLRSLVVHTCWNLLNPLLPSNLLKRLQNLKTLAIQGVTCAEYVFGSEDFGQEQIELEKLRLWGLEQLENIWRDPTGYAIIRNLRCLEVSRCDKLKYVFTYDVSQCLLQLEKLNVNWCGCLEMIIGPGDGTVKKIVLPKLRIFNFFGLPQLTSFYIGNDEIECPSLEALTAFQCPQFPTSTYNFHSRNRVKIVTG
ncbi:disease resistance protein RPS2 [Rosa chinensis]|uniref:disease resistance protein RPS2 n=1 Tax=Rosa chinensis TaxID=74649 RepID=UPI001AD93CC2|nr:disease resistance protein RPS2 [Rosa chinensis]